MLTFNMKIPCVFNNEMSCDTQKYMISYANLNLQNIPEKEFCKVKKKKEK